MLSWLKRIFHSDSCPKCKNYVSMALTKAPQLFALPTITVGHYAYLPKPDAEYLIQHLVPVDKKAEIPAGMYACEVGRYLCPECGYRRVMADIFLPVRDKEMHENNLWFDNGELDSLLYDN